MNINNFLLEIRYIFSVFILRILGWKNTTSKFIYPPNKKLPKKYVVFGEPHTHMLDFLYMLLFFGEFKLSNVSFALNQKFFNLFTRKFLNFLGAFPVNVNKKGGLVKQLIDKFNKSDNFILHIPPSGTRKYTPYWKSGFYYVALGANVPVVPAYLDGKKKQYGYGDPYYLTGNKKEDMDYLRNFYIDKNGIIPSNKSYIRLRDE